jgi:hypothetical protein
MNECYEAASCAQAIKPWLQLWIALWYVGFVAYYLYKAARQKKLIVNNQLVLGELLGTTIEGLAIPVIVTVVGAGISLLLNIAGCDSEPVLMKCGDQLSYRQVFYGNTLLFALLTITVLIICILWRLVTALVKVGWCTLGIAGGGIASIWKTIRLYIPVRW